uniref:Nitronate monooxygenase domain-containing protein n=1 Tax=Aplanochytrium stocchinoi TaxID=215587 RepID=A0A7S3PM86_9STRA
MAPTIKSPICDLFQIKYPILLAGMAKVSNGKLAAAVTNAGGLGVIGGAMKTPDQLQADVDELKSLMNNPNAPFGVDLLLPQVGGGARKTNKDYTRGHLKELMEVVVKSGAVVFVSAVGVPPQWVVEYLHSHGVMVANMVGHSKHVEKALRAGVDLIIAQGTEAGGHTGEIATSVLIPQCVDICMGRKSPLNGGPVHVIAAGGIYNGRGLAMSLSLGAQGIWVGTRFICAEESGASPFHQKLVVDSSSSDTIRTIIYTGRPLRACKNEYNVDYEENKRDKIKELQSKGIVVYRNDVETARKNKEHFDIPRTYPQYMGQAIGGINKIMPARDIVEEIMQDAHQVLTQMTSRL